MGSKENSFSPYVLSREIPQHKDTQGEHKAEKKVMITHYLYHTNEHKVPEQVLHTTRPLKLFIVEEKSSYEFRK